MSNKYLVINLKPYFTVLNSLVFFPLFALLSWHLGIKSMDLSGAVGLLLSIALSCFLSATLHFECVFPKKFYVYIILILSIILTILYYFRLNFEFVDIHCPTNLLGFVSQMRRGHFPVSFLAFPEFPANYHAGFPIIAGYISRWFCINEYNALRFLSVSIFFAVATAIQCFFLSLSLNKKFILGTLLFFFAFSFPIAYFWPEIMRPYWLKDTSIFDYFRSNSWPLTDLTLILMLFYFWKRKLNTDSMVIFSLYVLLFSVLNATVYSLIVMTTILYLAYDIVFFSESRKYWFNYHAQQLLIFLGLFLLIQTLVKILPSAFMAGDHYRQVSVGLRFFLKDYLIDMKGYVLQCGLLPWLGLIVSLPLLIKKQGTAITRWIAMLFLSAFFFPIIFYLKGITAWDNFHKFLLTSYLAGSVLIYITWIQAKGKQAYFLTLGILFVLIISAPNAWKMFNNETSINPTPAYNASNQDIIDFLKTAPKGMRLIPYAKEGYAFCSSYTEVTAASGTFANDGYCFWFFTLSDSTEADFVHRQNWWKTKETFQNELNKTSDGYHLIIVKKKYLKDFNLTLQIWEPQKKSQIKYQTFKNFILIHKKSSA